MRKGAGTLEICLHPANHYNTEHTAAIYYGSNLHELYTQFVSYKETFIFLSLCPIPTFEKYEKTFTWEVPTLQ